MWDTDVAERHRLLKYSMGEGLDLFIGRKEWQWTSNNLTAG